MINEAQRNSKITVGKKILQFYVNMIVNVNDTAQTMWGNQERLEWERRIPNQCRSGERSFVTERTRRRMGTKFQPYRSHNILRRRYEKSPLRSTVTKTFFSTFFLGSWEGLYQALSCFTNWWCSAYKLRVKINENTNFWFSFKLSYSNYYRIS